MPEPLEAVNLYLLRLEQGLLLVDTGIRSRKSQGVLEASLAELGGSLADVRHIVLTHPHVDHFGLAQRIAAASGATLHAHRVTRDYAAQRFTPLAPEVHPLAPFFRKLGAPPEVFDRMILQENYMQSRMAEPVAVAECLDGGQTLDLPPFCFEVLETPGHCPGHIALWEESRGMLLCGDHLHERRRPVCPIPLYPAAPLDPSALLAGNARDAHRSSLSSSSRLRARTILPGHGPVFSFLEPVLAHYRDRAFERERRLLDAAAEWTDLYSLSLRLFGPPAETVTWITLSETFYDAADLIRAGKLQQRESSGRLVVRA